MRNIIVFNRVSYFVPTGDTVTIRNNGETWQLANGFNVMAYIPNHKRVRLLIDTEEEPVADDSKPFNRE